MFLRYLLRTIPSRICKGNILHFHNILELPRGFMFGFVIVAFGSVISESERMTASAVYTLVITPPARLRRIDQLCQICFISSVGRRQTPQTLLAPHFSYHSSHLADRIAHALSNFTSAARDFIANLDQHCGDLTLERFAHVHTCRPQRERCAWWDQMLLSQRDCINHGVTMCNLIASRTDLSVTSPDLIPFYWRFAHSRARGSGNY